MSHGMDLLYVICERQQPGALRSVSQEDFMGDEEVRAYNYVRNHRRRFGELPTVDAIEEDCGVEFFRAEDSLEYYLEKVRERRTYNALVDPFNELRDALSSSDMPAAFEAVNALAGSIRANRTDDTLLDSTALGERVMELYRERHHAVGLIGVPTGWEALDEQSGGWLPTDLNAIVGRPKQGKTWLLLWSVMHAVDAGFSVLLSSMEMSAEAIGMRLFAMKARLNAENVRKGRLGRDGERRLEETMAYYAGLQSFHVYGSNMAQGTNELDGVISDIQPDIVFVDGLYLMRSPTAAKNSSTGDKVTAILTDLKRSSFDHRLPIIGTSQLNRESTKVRGGGNLETIGYSDAFSTHCSVILGISKAPARIQDPRVRVIRQLAAREGDPVDFPIRFSFEPYVQLPQIDLDVSEPDEAEGGTHTPARTLDWMPTR